MDPRFVLPVYGKGMGLFQKIVDQFSDRPADDRAELERCAQRALEIDDLDASGWILAGRGALMVGQVKRAIPLLERATTLNKSHARAYSLLGQAYIFDGNRAGFDTLALAARLSPRVHMAGLSLAYFSLGDYENAITSYRLAQVRRPGQVFAHAVFVAALALSGDAAGAREELAHLLELHPGFRRATFERMVPPGRHDTSDRILEGLQKAGLES